MEKTLRQKFKDFSDAYLELISDPEFEDTCNSEENLPLYPFHLSMDELNIPQWCHKISGKLEEDPAPIVGFRNEL